jgi:hypothetical protein
MEWRGPAGRGWSRRGDAFGPRMIAADPTSRLVIEHLGATGRFSSAPEILPVGSIWKR